MVDPSALGDPNEAPPVLESESAPRTLHGVAKDKPSCLLFSFTRRKVKQYFLNVKSFMRLMSIAVIFMKLRLIHSFND